MTAGWLWNRDTYNYVVRAPDAVDRVEIWLSV
jgi:hypothetical protein